MAITLPLIVQNLSVKIFGILIKLPCNGCVVIVITQRQNNFSFDLKGCSKTKCMLAVGIHAWFTEI